jgi:hypothetical protein
MTVAAVEGVSESEEAHAVEDPDERGDIWECRVGLNFRPFGMGAFLGFWNRVSSLNLGGGGGGMWIWRGKSCPESE